VVEVSILPLSASLHLDFGTVPTVCYFLFFLVFYDIKKDLFSLYLFITGEQVNV
jgi:hypothetical protein